MTRIAVDREAQEPTPPRQGVRGQFATCQVEGMLLLKLSGFIQEERAEILEISDKHIVLRLGQPWHLRWWHGEERRRPLSVRLDFAEPGNDLSKWQMANARRSVVNVDIRPLTWSFRRRDFHQRANAILRSLRLHFVAD